MTTTTGRRLPDTREPSLPVDIQRGDYWKALKEDGEPLLSDEQSNLTHGVWWVAAPVGDAEGFAIARLTLHTVREEDDGTISVRPGDGSSNSILISRGGRGPVFHGYIEHGVWSDA